MTVATLPETSEGTDDSPRSSRGIKLECSGSVGMTASSAGPDAAAAVGDEAVSRGLGVPADSLHHRRVDRSGAAELSSDALGARRRDGGGGGGSGGRLVGALAVGSEASFSPLPARSLPSPMSVIRGLSWPDRLLPFFILIAMVVGVAVSAKVESVSHRLEDPAWEGVGVPLCVGLLVMVTVPMCETRWEAMPRLLSGKGFWNAMVLAGVLNWLLGPFLMLGLAWATLPDLADFRAGIIMVGAARCVGMVLIWNGIGKGHADLAAALCVLNSALQAALYAPLVTLLIRVIPSTASDAPPLSYRQAAIASAIYMGIPLAAGMAVRLAGILATGSPQRYEDVVLPWVSPWGTISLIYVILVIFMQQGTRVTHNLGPAFRCFVPLVLYYALMWIASFFVSRRVSASERLCGELAEVEEEEEEEEGGEGRSGGGRGGGTAPESDAAGLANGLGAAAPAAAKGRGAGGKGSGASSGDSGASIDAVERGSLAPSVSAQPLRALEVEGRPPASGSPPAAHLLPHYGYTAAQAFVACSNNFELAMAVSSSVFGTNSNQTLATSIGALLEVPVLLFISYLSLYLREALLWKDIKRE